MRMNKARAIVATGGVLAMGLALGLSGVAQADTAARSGDIVGVGSDTLQNGADFLFDSAPGLTTGSNLNGDKNRVFNVFATGDANGRAVYDGTCGSAVAATGLGALCSTTTNQAPNLLAGSVILRDATKPVVRPNGSGAGIAALVQDSGSGYEGLPTGSIQYARASRLPNASEEGTCPTTGSCGGLDVYQAATDNLAIATVSSGFQGPAGLSLNELYHIYITCDYTTWGQIPGNSGSANASAPIDPLIPQSGSGTRNFFLADLQAAHGDSSVPSPGPCVRTVEEHDPTGIYGDPHPTDAIEPFSTGKIALINSGYFSNGVAYSGTGEANGAYTPGYLTTLSGTAPDNSASYTSSRGLYFVIRNADVTSTTPFQPGGTQNWAQTFFTGGTIASPSDTADAPAFLSSSKASALLTKAGFTPAYKACPGNPNPTSC